MPSSRRCCAINAVRPVDVMTFKSRRGVGGGIPARMFTLREIQLLPPLAEANVLEPDASIDELRQFLVNGVQ